MGNDQRIRRLLYLFMCTQKREGIGKKHEIFSVFFVQLDDLVGENCFASQPFSTRILNHYMGVSINGRYPQMDGS